MEDKPEKKRKKVLKRLRYKFRLVIINDDTYEEHFSLKLSLLNIITALGILSLCIAIFMIGLIAFTPFREYIPGYSNIETKRNAAYAYQKADSLSSELLLRENYLNNIRLILSGEIVPDSLSIEELKDVRIDRIKDVKSPEDSVMRLTIEEQEKYALLNSKTDLEDKVYFFFTPIKGTVVDHFDTKKRHYGTDIVTEKGEPIKAVMDGTIVMADYTTKSGFVVRIQHRNNLISVYKHCSAVLKQVGEVVSAGDPVAVVGNTGELSTGPHLHLELWENGIAIDSEKHIKY
ncbi:MAG: murein DD-endopeptidase MepM/ murein hydrolase activator NlpD [Salibacteraceae bacterium]|jgi:murein DD-endopeptidase MepM/ murein hydrolase activator NlpD